MRNGKGRQTVRGFGRGTADTRTSKGTKRYNTGNTKQGRILSNPRASGNGVIEPLSEREWGARAEERAFACRIRDWGPLIFLLD